MDDMRTWVFLVVAGLVLAGCGAPQAASGPSAGPSAAARMICAQDAQNEVSIRLGMNLTRPVSGDWSGDTYSCRYTYPPGSLVLSVRELSDLPATTAYFTSVEGTAHTELARLGDAAFAVPDGSVFVRKDAKVLHVDVAGLPARFGEPEMSRADAARGVAVVIMACWSGD